VAVVILALAGVGLGVGLREREDPEVAAGRALFEANCLMCHGEAGLGDGPMASSLPIRPPSLLDHLTHHTQAQLVQIIRAGLPPAMPPAPLTEDEVRLVIDHVWTLVPDSARAALRAIQAQTEQVGTGTAPGGGQVAEFAFTGTVAAVDTVAGSVAVLNDDVPGWMGSMTMSYALNPPDVLTTLTVGDRIAATVRAGDFGTLYDVEVAQPRR
jgi:mono/diheme cytochrome c family protein